MNKSDIGSEFSEITQSVHRASTMVHYLNYYVLTLYKDEQQLRQIFKLCDKDGNGQIDKDELGM